MQQPNVIVFFTDQQRYDTTGIHGNPLNLTPNFDRMARQGTDVHYSFTVQPVCGPARSCLQTGLYATQTGSYRNGIPLSQSHKTLAHHFKDGGYQTAYIGKWHLAPHEYVGEVPEEWRGGYDYWLAANVLEYISDAYDAHLFNNNNEDVKLPGYRVDALTDASIDYINRHKDNPFFLFLSFLEPHHQNHRDDYPAPTGYQESYRAQWIPPDLAELGGSTHQHLAGYYGMVKRLDEALGRLQDALRSLEILDNTIILFTSDHGCHFKTRNSEYKRSCHESSIRVPTAIQGPGFDGGGRISQLVSLVDLSPTLLDAAGLDIPETMVGKSLLPLVNRETVNWQDDIFIQISESHVGRSIRTKRWKYSVVAPDKDGWDHSNSETYVEEFLYDLKADPYELHNLVGAETHQEVSEVLRQRLIQRIKEIENMDVTITPAERRNVNNQLRVTSAEAHS